MCDLDCFSSINTECGAFHIPVFDPSPEEWNHIHYYTKQSGRTQNIHMQPEYENISSDELRLLQRDDVLPPIPVDKPEYALLDVVLGVVHGFPTELIRLIDSYVPTRFQLKQE